MTDYCAPVEDMRFVLKNVVGMPEIADLPGYDEATDDLVDAVLEEAGKLAGEVIGPLNHIGDQQGSVLENGVVRTPEGFKEAYWKFVEGGWNSVPFDPEIGGQGLPWTLNTAVQEMWDAANTGWSLCPMLTVGAIEAISAHGTNEQKKKYLPKLVTGEWTGTMNLTEPQAGSDVGALRSKAVRDGDAFRIHGQKIFITYGDQDYTDNVIHLVLARIEGAPDGVKGISLFIVPKVLVNDDGSLGRRNDLRPVSLEHKLGIHASPTCVMAYGENDGAIGYLIGEENNGMACMFTMMNNARLNVGVAGLGTAERAWQQARDFAKERTQGRDIATGEQNVPIIRHPDVRRMLLDMKAKTEAMRALCYYTAARMDVAKKHPDADTRRTAQRDLDLLIPITKAWCTDTGCDVAHTGVQVHGGMGFVEETGAAQHMRDARIHPIYEGTNGIQANDLIGRKILRDGGEAAKAFTNRLRTEACAIAGSGNDDVAATGKAIAASVGAIDAAVDWILSTGPIDIQKASANSVPMLNLMGNVVGGWLMGKAAAAAVSEGVNGHAAWCGAKIKTARFYADHILSRSSGLLATIAESGDTVMALKEDQF
ncbi:MAG: acyl-CoA dehydrogenase [Rhodospirillaceae bacterium]|nr:acyl-CoA dehydrogenase [Rhodospirillaceae bacterium]MCY4237012.1 acyl-CoA dehydrogenase [Rhodospirillaceae bacterium]